MAKKIIYSANFKCNYVAVLAVGLFVLMVIGEVILAVSIPVYMKRENVLSDEVRQRETLLLFDHLRRECNAVSGSDEVLMLEKQLVISSLDQMALYLRKESHRMTPEETAELHSLCVELQRIVAKLRKKQPFSRENRLDSSTYINSLVKKYSAKVKP